MVETKKTDLRDVNSEFREKSKNCEMKIHNCKKKVYKSQCSFFHVYSSKDDT